MSDKVLVTPAELADLLKSGNIVLIDTRDPAKPKNFLKDANLTALGFFSDDKAKVFQE